jgi:hypothetical protein
MRQGKRETRPSRGEEKARDRLRGVRVGVVPAAEGLSKVTYRVPLALDDRRGRPPSAIDDIREFEYVRVVLRDWAILSNVTAVTDSEVLRLTAARLTHTEWLLAELYRHRAGKRFSRRHGAHDGDLLATIEADLERAGNAKAREVRGAEQAWRCRLECLKVARKALLRGELAFPSECVICTASDGDEHEVPCDVCGAMVPKSLGGHRALAPTPGVPERERAWVPGGYACGLRHQVVLDNIMRVKNGLRPIADTMV